FGIAESMANLYTAAQNILAFSNPRLRGEDARRQFRVALREEHDRFTGTVNRSLIVLPSKVKAAVDHFNETLLEISAPDEDPPAGSQPRNAPEWAWSPAGTGRRIPPRAASADPRPTRGAPPTRPRPPARRPGVRSAPPGGLLLSPPASRPASPESFGPT